MNVSDFMDKTKKATTNLSRDTEPANLDEPTFTRRVIAAAQEPFWPLQWSTNPPYATGWWFNRPKIRRAGEPSGKVALFVFDRDGYWYALAPDGKHECDVRTMPDEWAGPLPDLED